VWVGERKIASIGIAVKKWVTYHGVALNAVNDLRPFHLIAPCGFAPEVMTRLVDVIPEWSQAEIANGWRLALETILHEVFDEAMEHRELPPAI
jgi:lipoate-protein ligase B